MRSFSDMWYDPVARKKILIFSGAGLAFIIIFIIIIVVATSGSKAVHFNGAMVLSKVPLVDRHNGLANNLFLLKQNQLHNFNFSDLTINEKWINVSNKYKSNTDLSRLVESKLRGQFWVASVDCADTNPIRRTLEQIDVIKMLIDRYDEMELVTDQYGIRNAFNHYEIGSLIGVEGGHSIGSSLAVLRLYYSLGVRYMTLTHECNTPWAEYYNATASQIVGLDEFGKTVIKEMNRLGMIVDIAHGSNKTMSNALDASAVRVIIKHSAAAAITNVTTNVEDSILVKLKENDGIIMVNFGSEYVRADPDRVNATINDVIMHLDYIRNITGSTRYVGIGADYDGLSDPTTDLADVARYADLFNRLAETYEGHQHWGREDLQNLAGENFLRLMATVEDYRDKNKEPINEDILPVV